MNLPPTSLGFGVLDTLANPDHLATCILIFTYSTISSRLLDNFVLNFISCVPCSRRLYRSPT